MYVLFIDGVDVCYTNDLVDCFNSLLSYQSRFTITNFEILKQHEIIMQG